MSRYQVRSRSESGHCCFEATVVDTHTPGPKWICECMDADEAERICELLNAAEPTQ